MLSVDVQDVLRVAEDVRLAVERCRRGRGQVERQEALPGIAAGLQAEGQHAMPYRRGIGVPGDVLNMVEH